MTRGETIDEAADRLLADAERTLETVERIRRRWPRAFALALGVAIVGGAVIDLARSARGRR